MALGQLVSHPAVLVALGSATGGVARYYLGVLGHGSHWATLAINVLGSLILGVVAQLCLAHVEAQRRELFLLLGVGFCGGFTTFSTFSREAMLLWQHGQPLQMAVYVLGSVVLSLGAFAIGSWLAR